MEEIMNEKMNNMMMANATSFVEMANATIEDMGRKMARKSMKRVGITMIVVGAFGWFCGKYISY